MVLSTDKLWNVLCGFAPFWNLLFVFNVIFLLMLAFSLVVLQEGSTGVNFYVALLSLGIVGTNLVVLSVLIRLCAKR